MDHKFVEHTDCHEVGCEGGLSLCEVCGGLEGSLPSECPGMPMSENEQRRVYAGLIDYHDGKWLPGVSKYSPVRAR